MMTNTFLVTGQKSVPLNSLPESAWQVIVGQYEGADRDIIKLYEHIPWLHRGVEARVNALSGMPKALHMGDESGDELAPDAYPFEVDFTRLLAQYYRFYILFARSYIWKQLNVLNRPMSLRLFHPDTMKQKVDKELGIVGYERRVNNATYTYELEEIAYFYKAGVKNEIDAGVSDAMVAASAAGILYDMDTHDETFFKNGAINPTLVTIAAGTQQSDRERLRSWYRRVLTGVKNAFSVEVVEGKPEVTTLGFRPKDLTATELTSQKREDIATALGVPQTLMFSNAANYATAAQDDLHFYDKTILPDAYRIEAVLNTIFQPLGYYFKFHPERMELFQQLEDSKANAVTLLYNTGLMEFEEGRAHMNLPPLPPEDFSAQDIKRQKQLEQMRRAVDSGIPYSVAATVLGIELPPELMPQENLLPAKSTYQSDVQKWRRMALKRYQEGKPAKALDFTSEALSTTQSAAIRGLLSSAKSSADVTRIFDHALHFPDYP